MELSAHLEPETGTPGEKYSRSRCSDRTVKICEPTLICSQADRLCGEIFCQSEVVHLHRPDKDGGVQELASGKTERQRLF